MNRTEKVKVLQAIRDGRLSSKELRPKQVYVFSQKRYSQSLDFDLDGVTYTPDEHQSFVDAIEAANIRREAVGLEADAIITIVYVSGKTIL